MADPISRHPTTTADDVRRPDRTELTLQRLEHPRTEFPEPLLLTIPEAARLLRISPGTLYDLSEAWT